MTLNSKILSIKLQRILILLLDIKAIKAMLSWPVFSITAYGIVSDLLKQGICPKTIIDVGANKGQFTVAALNIFKGISVYAFEPLATCAAMLRENTDRYKNVHVHAVALGAKQGKMELIVNKYSQASSFFRISRKHKMAFMDLAEIETRNIEVFSLDGYFADATLTAPVLLKIDVQGAEKMVIAGGHQTLKRVDYVLLEASFTPMYVGEPRFLELVEIMRNLHFEFIRPINFLKSPNNGEILQADILFKNTGI